MRLGFGPVFASERLTASRRWQYYALRAFGVAAVLVAMGTVAYSEDAFVGGERSVSAYTRLGRSYFNAMIVVELALVMLAVAGRDGRCDLPGSLARHARTPDDDRPVGHGDRAGQAGRPPAAGPGAGRLLPTGARTQLAARRH